MMPPFGMFLDPNFDVQTFLDAHPELQALLGDVDVDALNQALSDLRQSMSDTPRGQQFDWAQFLQDHPVLSDLLSQLHADFMPGMMGQMMPGFPFFGRGNSAPQNAEPLPTQTADAPA